MALSEALGEAMKRRDFIAGIAGSSAAWPLVARAQQPAMPVIGFLAGGLERTGLPIVTAYKQGLADIGYVEGKNVIIEYRWANSQRRRGRAGRSERSIF
jgi:putative tryptophan/tyrosine transport system substrate-binding protein